jgi:DNA-binding NarL/FixJ family response regulator
VESRLAALAGFEPPAAPTVTLAPRELDVLSYVAVGSSNAQIAQRLDLAESTVKAYVSSAMSKLGAGSRFEAVQRARAARLIP